VKFFGAQRRSCKAAAIFGADENNIQLWRRNKAAISVRHYERNSLNSRKDNPLKLMIYC
jgi:hypothetical protein